MAQRLHGAGDYEMLWDCKFCGTQKLLGVTHRHCPNCGSIQDPAWRYFPAEEEIVALENHPYVGADKICPACSQPNSAANTYCRECGADLATGKVAETQAARDLGTGGAESDTQRDVVKDQFVADMQRVQALEAAKPILLGLRKKEFIIVGAVAAVALVIVGAVFAFVFRQDTTGKVEALAWERTIDIENFQQRTDSSWDESVPGDSYSRSCTTRQRGTKRVESGSHQECRDVDKGDGRFSRECHNVTDYREEPVHDQWCTYKVDRWGKSREVQAKGGVEPEPYWPEYSLASGSGSKDYGKERAGDRHEKYIVVIRESGGDEHECDFENQSTWAQYTIDLPITFKTYITGGADCDTLKPK